ncbi:hypothetical protein IQ266_19655 [filamentous cyanobacterium LEGE 11480]|uniref:Uncharacterized protein n=1 Tax=Romeriopsis navalis LEGE 11480 TaxID=2777977 RepID=A0A928VNV0_9CYAN|nr:hypothetical protein [Romeriopsis navalis]MBE9031956.1 hypothetical protein [Romeriopsis navalis LEGE 11480]
MTKANYQPKLDDDMLPEYDFSQGVRGKHAHRIGQPYTVKITNGDGTATIKQFDAAGNMTQERHNVWTGDRISGDKIAGDKVMGNKVQIGTVQGDAVAGNKIVQSQDLAQAAKDIKTLLDQLSGDYDTSKQSGKMQLGAKILEVLESDVPMKKRFVKALKEGGTTALEEAIDHPLAKPVIAAVKGFLED